MRILVAEADRTSPKVSVVARPAFDPGEWSHACKISEPLAPVFPPLGCVGVLKRSRGETNLCRWRKNCDSFRLLAASPGTGTFIELPERRGDHPCQPWRHSARGRHSGQPVWRRIRPGRHCSHQWCRDDACRGHRCEAHVRPESGPASWRVHCGCGGRSRRRQGTPGQCHHGEGAGRPRGDAGPALQCLKVAAGVHVSPRRPLLHHRQDPR